MSEIQHTMQTILSGQATVASVELIAVAKIIQAAEILVQSGFENESKYVLDSINAFVKNPELCKQASAKEEILFEVIGS
jgi:hypothetical protein